MTTTDSTTEVESAEKSAEDLLAEMISAVRVRIVRTVDGKEMGVQFALKGSVSKKGSVLVAPSSRGVSAAYKSHEVDAREFEPEMVKVKFEGDVFTFEIDDEIEFELGDGFVLLIEQAKSETGNLILTPKVKSPAEKVRHETVVEELGEDWD